MEAAAHLCTDFDSIEQILKVVLLLYNEWLGVVL